VIVAYAIPLAYLSTHLEKAVLQLDVPVRDSLAVAVVKGQDELLEEPAGLRKDDVRNPTRIKAVDMRLELSVLSVKLDPTQVGGITGMLISVEACRCTWGDQGPPITALHSFPTSSVLAWQVHCSKLLTPVPQAPCYALYNQPHAAGL
jgi:hypothetical protein